MKSIKVYLNDLLIEYPEEYSKCIDNDKLMKKISNLNMDPESFYNNKKKILMQIKNVNKNGKYIYINGYATKHWQRYGYNHYTTKINNEEFTFVCTEDNYGCDIPIYILEQTIEELYKNINILEGTSLINYYEMISKTGFSCKFDSFYDNKQVIINTIISFMRLYYYLDNNIIISYNSFKLPKKKGGYRTIESPSKDLKEVQRLILDLVLKNIPVSLCSTGFIEGKSIINNANKHINKKFVLNIDLENFFNTIGSLRVYSMFIAYGIQHKEAEKMTNICTYKGCLPQGAPSSPCISNIICNNLDKRLANLCKIIDGNYTRYADDITISTNNAKIKKYIKTIEKIIIEEGFQINYKKHRLLTHNTKQVVTGIVVNEKLNIDKNYIRKIRQELYYCNKYGIKQHMLHENINIDEDQYINSLKGKINFIKSINPNVGNKLEDKLQILTYNT